MSHDETTPPTADSLFERYLAARGTAEAVDFAEICRAHPGLAAELHGLYVAFQRVDQTLEDLARDDPAEPFSDLFDGLQRRRDNFHRYRIGKELGRGGMGIVLEVHDRDLDRSLAMKRLHLQTGSAGADLTRAVGRFLEEAQITGKLEHPGIVPVHELGLDDDGQLYFTMQRVHGDDLRAVLEKVELGVDDWTVVRALGVLLRACEAVAYAHDRGVIHRDLKPSNIMVGRFGETYVMDWGLARLKESVELHSIRQAGAATDLALETPGASPLMTRHGDVLGTPAYMPPEQADGRIDEIGPHSDVYAMGALLYHLLAGFMPYSDVTDASVPEDLWQHARQGPPTSLGQAAPQQPPELAAICDKAMARTATDRYPSMAALADDIRAFLENRVVQAHATGPWVEFRKWTTRNRALATTLLGGLFLIVAGSTTAALVFASKNESIRTAQANAEAENRVATEAQEFLVELFKSMSPTQSQEGQPLLASELLERGAARAARIEGTETRLRVLYWVGSAYNSLGQPDTARPLLEQTLQETTDPATRYGTVAALGGVYESLGMREQARMLFEQELPAAVRELGDEHDATNTIRQNLGMLHFFDGELDLAERLLDDSLRIETERFTDPSPRLMTNLAFVYLDQGRVDQAEALVREAIESGSQSARFGPLHVYTLDSSRTLGRILKATGRGEEAAEIWAGMRDDYETALGRTHPAAVELAAELARHLAEIGRAEEAEVLLLDTREICILELGEDSNEVSLLDGSLGVIVEKLGRPVEAEAYYREALAWSDTEYGTESMASITLLHNIVRLALDQGRGEQERPLLERLRRSMPRGQNPFFEQMHERLDATLGEPASAATEDQEDP